MEHTPVLVKELLDLWQAKPGDCLLDATAGLGGHMRIFLEATQPKGTAVGLDADPTAVGEAKKRLASYGDRVSFYTTAFHHIPDQEFTHVLFDLGVGSHQLGDETRGFSFKSKGSLLMRYGHDADLPKAHLEALTILEQRLQHLPEAMEIIHGLSAEALAEVIRTYGEERYSYRIAKALQESVTAEMSAETVATIISDVVPAIYRNGRIHPATRTFQALRIAVNRELECLEVALPKAFEVLKPGGVLTVISFHSLEDRLVKHFMRSVSKICVCPPEQPQCTCSRQPQADLITKHPLQALEAEITLNPRARSAKLRAIRKR